MLGYSAQTVRAIIAATGEEFGKAIVDGAAKEIRNLKGSAPF